MPVSHQTSATALAREIKSGGVRNREKAVDSLTELLRPQNRAANLADLKDKSYHEIFEALFTYVLQEKSNLYDKRKSSTSTATSARLSKCAKALRVAVSRGAPKLGRKTLLAVIDHITQVLTSPDDGFVMPLLQEYIKAITELLSHPFHVELLCRKDGAPWDACVDFLLDIITHFLPSEPTSSIAMALSRGSPAPGSTTPHSTARTAVSLQSQLRANIQSEGNPLRDAVIGLYYLVKCSNRPVHRRSRDIAKTVTRLLGVKRLGLDSTQTFCFAIFNEVFIATHTDDFALAVSMVKEVMPLLGYWWRGDKVSQDQLITGLRNEISKTIFLTGLHIEHLTAVVWDVDVRNSVGDLLEVLWAEYSKRSQAFRLRLPDITFTSCQIAHSHLSVGGFALCPHNIEGESYWAIVENMALLEACIMQRKLQDTRVELDIEHQPRKKMKTHEGSSRIKMKLKSKDLGIQETALQLIPFMLARNAMSIEDIGELLVQLSANIDKKNTTTASWALIACSSCALHPDLKAKPTDLWRQIWQVAARSVCIAATCRAASFLLHCILETDTLLYETIAEDINGIITIADVNGPVLLCDTSLALMFHLLHVRKTRLPNASQATSNHIIRWLFLRWNPNEPPSLSMQSSVFCPHDAADLVRACCSMPPLEHTVDGALSGGTISEAWKTQKDSSEFNSYLLLLNRPNFNPIANKCRYISPKNNSFAVTNSSSIFAVRKLVLELLFPKIEELQELCRSWSKKQNEGGSQISLELFIGLLAACIFGATLSPLIQDLNSVQSTSIEPLILSLVEKSLTAALDSVEPDAFIHATLRIVRPCIPVVKSSEIWQLQTENRGQLCLLSAVSKTLEQRNAASSFGDDQNIMDIDDEFDSQTSRATSSSSPPSIPRQNLQMSLNQTAFYVVTRNRLQLLTFANADHDQMTQLPDAYLDELLAMSNENILCCQQLLVDISKSDLALSPVSSLRLVERLGAIVSLPEYHCSEVALTTCLEVMEGLHRVWLQDDQDLSQAVGDLYNHFVKVGLVSNILSPKCKISLASLLFTLMRVDASYATNLGMDSCRTSLFFILSHGPMEVQCFIAEKIAELFDLFILMLHDEVFVDVLNSLPTNPDNTSGIAFRLLTLSNLACRWPTLLRRCTYHIFETPGKISLATEYAQRCIVKISDALGLDSPQDLFLLFSRQLLYTWLESDTVDSIPFSIFGFDSLPELLQSSQAEIVGLALMRGQDDTVAEITSHIGQTESELIQQNFTTALAYSMIYGDAFGGPNKGKGEERIKDKLGSKLFSEAMYSNLVDIVGLFFDLIDQEGAIEKVLFKHPDLSYAGNNLVAIKKVASSEAKLPPNQQPTFRAKYVFHELFRLCQTTEFQFLDIWTPALIMLIARKLLNSIHPALGSLHACSVIRKLRLLISLAGDVVLESYCLEMLLNSVRTFIVDSECADDALGISQYLLQKGAKYLTSRPSFVAGYALSTLASLRVFLESSQASTTQESQFKATMGKAQNFHQWFSEYLERYDSPSFLGEAQRSAFKSITGSAAKIRSSGNADRQSSESSLLFDILDDQIKVPQLLNEPSRELALGLLCGDFTIPELVQNDIVESDEDAIRYASAIWKSCEASNLSENYLIWAGRVVGRSFSATGEVPEGILRETRFGEYTKIAFGSNGSEKGLLSLLETLVSDPSSLTAGLAEAALRTVMSEAVQEQNEALIMACQQTVCEPLLIASQWGDFRSSPSELKSRNREDDQSVILAQSIVSPGCLTALTIHLSQSTPASILLSVLPPILSRVKGFAEKAFPFIVHLVLLFQVGKQQSCKKFLSEAMKTWLQCTEPLARENQKLLINAIIYLRAQAYPKELSVSDRLHWLDIDYSVAAASASRCGMYKTGLLFTEMITETSRTSRRSTGTKDVDINDTLLTIFENIDDPDAYYGLPEDASLSNVLARVEYENEGRKSLAFRGAQYDSHIRLRDPESQADSQALVKALGMLGLAGLSNSLLQTQQDLGSTFSSMDSTFRTASRLEIWNLPAPSDSDHHAVSMYKTYQSIHQASDMSMARSAIYDGLSRIMSGLTRQNVNATTVRNRLAALAAMTELDDVLNVSTSDQLNGILAKFERRGEWMKSGMYDDVSNILSCRNTTMSLLSQQKHLRHGTRLPPASFKHGEVKSMLMASGIYRFHKATQESLYISTTLSDLIAPCDKLGMHIDAAVNIEVAQSLWDHGEVSTSIRMLQGINRDSSLRAQTIPVSRSELLSTIGNKVSIARLEKPRDIQKLYLEPALKELKGVVEGKEAGQVFHQFAVFCDEQLQDADGIEDLERLQSLKKGKSEEVEELKSLISSTRDSQLKNRYSHVLAKEKQWLDLDEQELRRVEQTRSEFVRLSLENYLLSLIASDRHDNDALRFTALWLERSDEDSTNKAVTRYLDRVPTRKFANLMNQLTSRLQNHDSVFQKLLLELVYNICIDHPYHGMYQIWSGTKAKAQEKDEVAVKRVRATEKVAQRLAATKSVAEVWLSIDKTSKYYHGLAMERSSTKYKSGSRMPLRESNAGHNLINCLARYRIPPPTLQLGIKADKDYSTVPMISKLEPTMAIASGVSAPKIITVVANDGTKHKQLVKGGHDDLRQDAIMEQVFAAVSSLLKLHRSTQQRNLGIRTYKVLPLTASSGLIEFVPNTIPLHEFLMPAHERYFPKDLKGSQCRKEIFNVQNRTVETRISTYRKVTERFHPVMKYFFTEYFVDPDEWYMKRLAYTRSTAAISMLGHILGLGDRHGHNILLDTKTGEVVHIDLGVAFEAGRILPVPELVPFRLTRDTVDGMGITKTEGVFRRCCEFTLDALREEQYSIMTILDVLRYDPLYTWSISPLRLAKLQKARNTYDGTGEDGEQSEAEAKKGRKQAGHVNEPSEADRALEVVRKKLSKALSVAATVNDLINQATDERNLAVLYSGWAAYA